jgi:uncharacterized iron-regulated protein
MNRPQATQRALCLAIMLLAGCAVAPMTSLTPAQVPAALKALGPSRVLLLGEQHDADAHQALERAAVEHLAQQGQLAALVLEMAERGPHTRGLPRNATEAQVQAALQWNGDGWPWERYGPVVMDAVRAGVPVLGGNQPRSEMRAAMANTTLDASLDPQALARQRENIAQGHCGLLPASQLAPMARIQIARDRAMAQTLLEAAASATDDQVLVLVAGTEHVRRGLGVPAHLPPEWATSSQVVVMHSGAPKPDSKAGADHLWLTPATDPKDHCAGLRQRWGRPAAP